MPDDTTHGGRDIEQQGQMEPGDARYGEEVAEHDAWPIGDTNTGTGTLRPTDDVGTGGPGDIAGARDFGGTSSIRTGQAGVAGVLGSRLGDVGPATGATGATDAERGGLDALAGEPSTASAEAGPVDRSAMQRAEGRVDTGAGGGLNNAAVEAAAMPGTAGGGGDLPGTADLGAAAGGDLGSGLGQTRGDDREPLPGEVSGIGGTRGSGAGTGHLEDTPG